MFQHQHQTVSPIKEVEKFDLIKLSLNFFCHLVASIPGGGGTPIL